MAIIKRETERGIARLPKGWAAIEREVGHDDSGLDVSETKRRLIDGPFNGSGAKLRAIRAAGSNTVIA